MLDAVSSTDGLSTVSQLVASERILNESSSKTPPSTEKNSGRWYVSYLYQYWLSCQKLWSRCMHVSVALDAGRVAGDDLMQQCLYSIEEDRGCWAPPQVHASDTCRFGSANGFHRVTWRKLRWV
eukprot:6458613-Amphidinium_carterae.4